MTDRNTFSRLDVLMVASICIGLTLGAVWAFPEMDDGYLLLSLRESGIGEIFQAHTDRPIVAYLWQTLVSVFGEQFWRVGFILHAVLWTVLGLQAGLLWRALFPEGVKCAVLVSCLTVAPIVVRCQISTVTISLIGVLSSVLAYGALLLLLKFIDQGGAHWRALAAGLALLAAGIFVSEYAIPVATMTVVVALAKMRRDDREASGGRALQVAIAAGVVSVMAYVTYLATAHGRDEVDPRGKLISLSILYKSPFGLFTRAWRSTVGAYGDVIGAIYTSWESASSILALACGLVAALILVARFAKVLPVRLSPHSRKSIVLALIALFAGLIPIALMRPSPSLTPFASRLYIPVLPLATCVTVYAALSIVRKRLQIVVVAVLGVLIGTSLFSESWSAVRRQRLMRSVGAYLKDEVSSSDGYTVAVISTVETQWGGV